MKIAGIQKLTLLDFPGHTACTVFLAGCNMRCGYCHNKELVIPKCIEKIKPSFIKEETFFNFLKSRQDLLDGVCITGGEPTLHPQLPEFIKKIRALKFKVKLDTNGTNSKITKQLIEEKLIDYIAMDIKTTPTQYSDLTALPPILLKKIETTKNLIIKSQIPHEFRTTVIKGYHTPSQITEIAKSLKGAKRFFIQNFQKKGGCISPKFEEFHSFNEFELSHLQKNALTQLPHCEIRS